MFVPGKASCMVHLSASPVPFIEFATLVSAVPATVRTDFSVFFAHVSERVKA